MSPVIVAVRDQPFTYSFSNTYGNEELITMKVVTEVFEVKHNRRQHILMVTNMLRDKERNTWKK